LLIAKAFQKFSSNRWVNYAFLGLRPVTVGLIASAALLLMNKENFTDYKSILIFSIAFILTKYLKIHPILMIVLAGLSGLLLY
jgi:chromate transporter